MVIPLDKDGNATIDLSGALNLSDFPSGTYADTNGIRYELRTPDTSVVAVANSAAGQIDLPQGDVATYGLAAWFDGNGNGVIANNEAELSVTVETALLTALTTYSVNIPENFVISDVDSTDDVLFVELEDGETSVPVEFFPTYSTSSGIPADYLFYSVECPNIDENQAFDPFSGDLVL